MNCFRSFFIYSLCVADENELNIIKRTRPSEILSFFLILKYPNAF